MITVTQAAERMDVSRQRIHQFINDGRLPAKKVGSVYIIDSDDLDNVKPKRMGRPPKEE